MRNWLISILLILTLSSCVKTPHDYITSGNDEYEKENFDGAADDYSAARQRKPSDAKATYNFACANYKADKFELAAENFSKTLEYSRSEKLNEKANFNLGNSYYRLSQSDDKNCRELLQKSLDAYSKVIKKNSVDTFALKNYYFVKKVLDSLDSQQQQQNNKQDNSKQQQQNNKQENSKQQQQQQNNKQENSQQQQQNDKKENSQQQQQQQQQQNRNSQSQNDARDQLSKLQSQLKQEQQNLKNMQKKLAGKKNKKSSSAKQLKKEIGKQQAKIADLKNAIEQEKKNLQKMNQTMPATMNNNYDRKKKSSQRNEAAIILNAAAEDEKLLQSQLKKQKKAKEAIRPRQKQW